MSQHHKINYIELAANDLTAQKQFFSQVFGWQFVDYGPDYCAIEGAGLDGGFYRADLSSSAESGGALVVLYSDQLEATQGAIVSAGGAISKPTFSFPGGKRFHFLDPAGNEWAVWSAE